MKNVTKTALVFLVGLTMGALVTGVFVTPGRAMTAQEDLMTVSECAEEASQVSDDRTYGYDWNPTNKLYERKGICRVDYKGESLPANEARRRWAADNLQGYGEE